MDSLKDYILLERIGSGSFGTVWKALRRLDGQLVAIKMIDLEESDEDIMELQREIAFLQSCDRKFVTQYHECFVAEAQLCIVMELMAGGSVLDLAGSPDLSETHIALICRQSLASLEYLHAQGRIHRDIKAANILVDGHGCCKLADLGVAAQVSSQRSRRHTFVGTPFWMAPEVIEQMGYDSRADIWSLGITAIELALGQPPLTHLHPMRAIFHIPKNPPPRLPAGYSASFHDFVAQCLCKAPSGRPFSRDLVKHRFLELACEEVDLSRLVESIRSKRPREQSQEDTVLAPATKNGWQFETVRARSTERDGIAHSRVDARPPRSDVVPQQVRRSSWEHSWPDRPPQSPSGGTIDSHPANDGTVRPSSGPSLLEQFLVHNRIQAPTDTALQRFFQAAEALRQHDHDLSRTAIAFLHGAQTIEPVEDQVTSPISQLLYSRWLQEIQRRWRS